MSYDKLVEVDVKDCPKCGGNHFKYHPIKEREVYKDKIIVGKFECVKCGWQSGLNGEYIV